MIPDRPALYQIWEDEERHANPMLGVPNFMAI